MSRTKVVGAGVESVVAVIGANPEVGEQALTKEVSEVEFQAEAVVISNDVDYGEAAELGKLIKQKAAEVTDFFKPMKDAAYRAHKEVCDREKSMLAPLKNAEKIIKKTMGDYMLAQEKKRQEQEAALKALAEAEAKRKLEQAVALEGEGKTEEAHAALADAEVMESVGMVSAVATPPKVKGVSATKDWELVSVSGAEVPLSFAGVELRPVDEAAVMRLIRASKGQIQIPGIVYRETTKMSFSRR